MALEEVSQVQVALFEELVVAGLLVTPSFLKILVTLLVEVVFSVLHQLLFDHLPEGNVVELAEDLDEGRVGFLVRFLSLSVRLKLVILLVPL